MQEKELTPTCVCVGGGLVKITTPNLLYFFRGGSTSGHEFPQQS